MQQNIEFRQRELPAEPAARSAPGLDEAATLSIGRIDRLEESLYWLLSAPTLVYLILAIIGR
jgi:hypothetical protein